MTRAIIMACVLVLAYSASALAQQGRRLTLEDALRTARAHAPELAQARAATLAARARVDAARAPLLPQVNGSIGYERGTNNSPATGSDFDTDNQFNFGVSANQLIYDFGQTTGSLDAAKARASAEAKGELSSELQVDLGVRVAYFSAASAKALLAVSEETLANQKRHLEQIQSFVEAGTRPPIDLAQARSDVANARLLVVRSQNNYGIARAQLTRAMGAQTESDFEVDDVLPAEMNDEDAPLSVLVEEAFRARPELTELREQARAQELSADAIEGGYGPSLGLSTAFTEGGRRLDDMAWNWNAGIQLTWPLFQGGITNARVKEARATLSGVRAQLEVLQKETRFAVEEARTTVQGARVALEVSADVVAAAQDRLTLAEGRYAAGVGNVIELGDAQLGLRDAQGQRVQAQYELASARARLFAALGRR